MYKITDGKLVLAAKKLPTFRKPLPLTTRRQLASQAQLKLPESDPFESPRRGMQ